MSSCLSSFLSRFPAAKASATSLTRWSRLKGRGRKEHDETVESGDTGGGSASGFTRGFLRKPAALRSAPSKDRQIAGVYTAISREGKGVQIYTMVLQADTAANRSLQRLRAVVASFGSSRVFGGAAASAEREFA